MRSKNDNSYYQVFQSANDAFVIFDLDGNIVEANQSACELYGYQYDQLLQLAGRDIVHGDYYYLFEEFIAGKDLQLGEYIDSVDVRSDGTSFNVEVRGGKIIFNQQPHRLAIIRDATARKKAEKKQEEQITLFAIGSEIGSALTAGETLQDMLQTCCDILVRFLGAAFARIWIYNKKENVLSLQASGGMYIHLDGAHSRISLDESYKIAEIAVTGKPHLTNQVIGDPQVHDQDWAKREGMVAFAGHPLIVDGQIVGVMALFAKQPLSDTTLDYLASVANEISLGIIRKQNEQGLKNANRALRTLSTFNEILVRARSEDQFMQDICEMITTLGGYKLAWVGFADNDDDKTVRPVAEAGFSDRYLETVKISWADNEYGQGPTGTAIRTGKPMISNEILTDPKFSPWREQAAQRGYASSIALPLINDKAIFGALNIYAEESYAFSEEEVGLLKELAGDVVYGLYSLRLQDQHKSTTEALQQKRAEFEAVFNAIPDAIAVTDNAQRVVLTNPAFTQITGYSASEFIGQHIEVLFFSQEKRCYHSTMTQKTVSAEVTPGVQYETMYQKRNGISFPVETVRAPILNRQGDVQGYITIFRDLSEKKASEVEREQLQREIRQSQKMEALGTLAGGIAHDFNNILSAIMGYTELALYNLPSDSAVHEDLQNVAKAGLRAKDLVAQILAFSRQVERERKPVELQIILKEALKLLRATIPRNIDFHNQIALRVGAVLADPSQLHQIIMNLCTNAYHAMRDQDTGVLNINLQSRVLGRMEIAALGLQLEPGDYVEMIVGDTGVGIAPENLERVFDPYFTTKERGEGTGLGLAVVRGIVVKLGGAVHVQSEIGKGTTFYVWLPRVQDHDQKIEAVFSQELITGTERIMLVDDEEIVANMMQKMLAGLGYKVTVFTSSEQAWQNFEANPEGYDLVFTDMAMPKMTGAEFAKRVHDFLPQMPIVMCTGFSDAMNEKKAKMLGIRQLIMKPVLLRDVSISIRKALDNEN